METRTVRYQVTHWAFELLRHAHVWHCCSAQVKLRSLIMLIKVTLVASPVPRHILFTGVISSELVYLPVWVVPRLAVPNKRLYYSGMTTTISLDSAIISSRHVYVE